MSNPDNEPSGIVGGRAREGVPEGLSQDIVQSERSRPDLPAENAEGLDDTDEDIRRQAEDLPLDTPGRQ